MDNEKLVPFEDEGIEKQALAVVGKTEAQPYCLSFGF